MFSKIDINIAGMLAHSILFEQREELLWNGIESHTLRNGSDPAPATTGESTQQQLQAYIQNLPQLLNTTAAQTLPVGQTTQTAQNTLAPEQQALQTSMATQDLPGLTQLGNQLNALQNTGGIANANAAITGTGGQLAQNTAALQQQLDPQYYATRATEGSTLSNLLGQLGVGGVGVSGSDTANINRGLAQQDAQKGLLNAPSQTQAVSNAMQFGQQGVNLAAQKTNTLSQALNAATSFLPSSQGQVSAFNTGTGAASNQPTTSGTSNFLGTTGTSNTGSTAASNSSTGNSLLGDINTTANNSAGLLANRRNSLDMTTQLLGSLPSVSA